MKKIITGINGLKPRLCTQAKENTPLSLKDQIRTIIHRDNHRKSALRLDINLKAKKSATPQKKEARTDRTMVPSKQQILQQQLQELKSKCLKLQMQAQQRQRRLKDMDSELNRMRSGSRAIFFKNSFDELAKEGFRFQQLERQNARLKTRLQETVQQNLLLAQKLRQSQQNQRQAQSLQTGKEQFAQFKKQKERICAFLENRKTQNFFGETLKSAVSIRQNILCQSFEVTSSRLLEDEGNILQRATEASLHKKILDLQQEKNNFNKLLSQQEHLTDLYKNLTVSLQQSLFEMQSFYKSRKDNSFESPGH